MPEDKHHLSYAAILSGKNVVEISSVRGETAKIAHDEQMVTLLGIL